jgi:hypothetical protein
MAPSQARELPPNSTLHRTRTRWLPPSRALYFLACGSAPVSSGPLGDAVSEAPATFSACSLRNFSDNFIPLASVLVGGLAHRTWQVGSRHGPRGFARASAPGFEDCPCVAHRLWQHPPRSVNRHQRRPTPRCTGRRPAGCHLASAILHVVRVRAGELGTVGRPETQCNRV